MSLEANAAVDRARALFKVGDRAVLARAHEDYSLDHGRIRAATTAPGADVSAGFHASDAVDLIDRESGARAHVALAGATAAVAEPADGYLVYRGAYRRGDVTSHLTSRGAEQGILFWQAPGAEKLSYVVAMDDATPSVRIENGGVALLGRNGEARFGMLPARLVDKDGRAILAKTQVEGCNVSDGRALVPAGSSTCTVTLSWEGAGLAYPVMLSAAWGVADHASRPMSAARIAAASGTPVSTAAGPFAYGASIAVTYSGLPGNAQDWIALSPSASAATSFTRFVYTKGLAAGTVTFTGATPPGTYVARAYINNSYTISGESNAFDVSASVGTTTVAPDASSYAAGATITLNYTGMSGSTTDWLAIAPQGSVATSYIRWTYTMGQAAGAAVFAGTTPPGTYVGRAFFGNSFAIAAESSAFTVLANGAQTTVTTDRSAYALTDSALVSFTNMLGSSTDWVAIAPQGSPASTYDAWRYTGGIVNGSASFPLSNLTEGSHVARVFFSNSFAIAATSAAFNVGSPRVSTDLAAYASGATITVSYANMPGNNQDWIAIALAGSPLTSYVTYQYTMGRVASSASFVATNVSGTYVARAFANNSYTLLAESPSFTITAPAATVTTDAAAYTTAQSVTVTYGNMLGDLYDWISIAPQGSGASTFTAWGYTGGGASGQKVFPLAGVATGSYVARAYFANGFIVQGESTAFTVSP